MLKAKIVLTITKECNLENTTLDELINQAYDDPFEFLSEGNTEMEVFGRTTQ